MPKLTDKYSIKGKTIKNRIVMPPMVCFGLSDKSGFVTDGNISHYKRRADAGTGIIIVEATCVSEDGKLAPDQLGIWSDNHIPGLKRLAEGIKESGCIALIQIHHVGFKETGITDIDKKTIENIRKDFVSGYIRAREAGFDGIEIHGAHGFFISQILSPVRNKRRDEYGGCLENRFLFVKKLLQDIRQYDNSDFIIGYRMGGNEPCVENGISIAHNLIKEGVDLLNVSGGISDPKIPVTPPESFSFSTLLYIGSKIKGAVKDFPVIVVGGIRTPSQAQEILDKGYGDFTAIGKAMLRDPEWAEKALTKDRKITECLECKKCGWFTKADNCPNVKK